MNLPVLVSVLKICKQGLELILTRFVSQNCLVLGFFYLLCSFAIPSISVAQSFFYLIQFLAFHLFCFFLRHIPLNLYCLILISAVFLPFLMLNTYLSCIPSISIAQYLSQPYSFHLY